MNIHKTFFLSILVLLSLHAFAVNDGDNDSLLFMKKFGGWTEEQIKAYEDSVINVLTPQPKLVVHPVRSTASMSSPIVASSQVEPTLLTSVPTTATIDHSRKVGKIEIIPGMTPTGARTYKIPIQSYSVEGRPSPGISLTYNSQRGRSIAGVGWNIGGISIISRGNQTYFYDVETRAASFTSSDAFYIDGVRLIPQSQTSTGIDYETETGQVKVHAFISNEVVKYFKVYYPNGDQAVMGFTTNNSDKLLYPITNRTDPHGNQISYSYSNNENYYDITSIAYNGAEINFGYLNNRPDPISYYSAGTKVLVSRRLSTVTCKFSGNTQCVYSLTYEMTDGVSLLKQVDFQSGGYSLNPLVFYYGNGESNNSYTQQDSSMSSGYDDITLCHVRKARINYGDSSDDAIVFPVKLPYWNKKRHSTAFQHSQNYLQNQYTGNEDIIIYSEARGQGSIKTGTGFIDLLSADLYGNNSECLIKINDVVDNYRDKVTFSVYRDFGNGLVKDYERSFFAGYIYIDNDDNKSIHPKRYFTGDFTGDGKMEVLAVSANNALGETTRPTKCYLFDLPGNSLLFEGSTDLTYQEALFGTNQSDAAAVEAGSDRMFVIDFNGDGKSDLCHVSSSGTQIFTFERDGGDLVMHHTALYTGITRSSVTGKRIFASELNGDGLTDLLVTPSFSGSISFAWKGYESKGDGSFQIRDVSGPGTSLYMSRDDFQVQDVDKDGVSEVISSNGNYFTTYKFNGDNLNSACVTTVSDAHRIVPVDIASHNHFARLTTIGNDATVSRHLYQKNAKLDWLITGMVNSHGVVETNSYLLGSKEYGQLGNIYTKGTNAIFPYVNILEPIQLLTSFTDYLDGIPVEMINYSYYNGISHRQGLGFCGFSWIKERDRRMNIVTRSYQPMNYSVLVSEDAPDHLDQYTYDIQLNDDLTRRILPATKFHRDKLTNVTLSTSYEYDTWGFPTSITTVSNDGIVVTEENTYIHNSTADDGYHLGFVTDRTQTTERDGASHSERSHVSSYSSELLPLEVLTYVNGEQTSRRNYGYNQHGNVTSEALRKFSSASVLTSTCEYDSYGRVTKSISPLGLAVSCGYNTNGRLSWKKDHLGNITTFTYDAFGRLASSSRPDNTVLNVTYSWTDSSEDGLYKTVVTETGKPSKTIAYDALDREVCVKDELIGQSVYTNKVYDVFRRLQKESLPHNSTGTVQWINYSYDSYDRVKAIAEPSGRNTSISYQGRNVTTVTGGKTVTRETDSQGNVLNVADGAGTVSFTLRPDGNPQEVTTPGNGHCTVGYDLFGRRVSVTDQSLGTTQYLYDNAGNLWKETNAKGEVTEYGYDNFGRMTGKSSPEMTVTYTYNNQNQLTQVTSDNGTSKTYSYDSLGRLSSVISHAPGSKWLKEEYTYSSGNVSSIKYTSQSGLLTTENYTYDSGHLKRIALTGGTVVYEVGSVNASNLPLSATSGPVSRTYAYTSAGLPTLRSARIGTATPFQNISYVTNPSTENITSRSDNTRQLTEQFGYDGLHRLTSFGGITATYDVGGNITSKSDVGTYEYGNSQKPYMLTGLSQPSTAVSQRAQTVTYTSFSRPATIEEDNYTAAFLYDENGDRVRMTLTKNGAANLTRYYLGGNYEMDVKPNSSTERLYDGGDYYTAPAVLVKTSSGSTVHYILRDHLGSITHVVSGTGQITQEYSYDAWGRLRNPATQQPYTPGSEPEMFLGRGFTGHEHLTMFGLINMNARLYDPALGRFLSPDPVIQDPEDSQNYNRYTYCLNNPLAFVDLTGETFYYTRNNESINKFLYAKYGGDAYLYLSYYYDGPWYYHPYSKGLDPYVLYYDDAVNKFFYSTQGGVKNVMPGYLDMYPKEAYSGYSGGGLPHGGGKGSSAGSGSGSSTMSTVHDVLDIVGLIPGFDAADLINAGIYLIEGDKINAALSMAAVIPVIGGAATAGKMAGKTAKIIERNGVRVYDGMVVTSSEALEMADKFLGKGYKDGRSGGFKYGRYTSEDGKGVVRLADNDILGRHAGGSHFNFGIMVPNSTKPNKYIENSVHVFLRDVK